MNFFIKRPIFAASIALITILAGLVCMMTLPISRFPPLVPPQVQIQTQYIGASADVVANTVTAPLEEQLNGAAGMIYMTSTSTNNGDCCITITFDVGFNQDIGQMEALTQSNQALSQLPSPVQQVGLTIQKHSSNMLLAVSLSSPKGTYNGQFLQNYADIHITDALSRIPGVASVTNFGLSQYAMRIWLDAEKLQNLGVTATDVQSAVKEQNQQVAAGALGQAPAPKSQVFQYQLNTLGRLDQVSQFENIIIKTTTDGEVVHIKDVGRVELGSMEYDWATKLDNKDTASLIVFQLANANGLQIKDAVIQTMKRMEKNFPQDVTWAMCYDTTRFIHSSIKEVLITLFEAILLVVLVVYIFLQNFRATLIPTIAVPVSLIGTFVFMALMGFSINILSLLGLVLAVALVVDDAIVVVENVMRKLEETPGRDLKEVTAEAIAEVRGPIIATTLVLMAVFVPVAFIPGMTGMLYNQFSLTIAISVGLSGINSLSLSPALCGVFLKAQEGGPNIFFRAFNKSFGLLTDFYTGTVRKMLRFWYITILIFLGFCAVTAYLFMNISQGFIPEEDQGYFIVFVMLPEGHTIDRTKSVVGEVASICMKEAGVDHVLEIAGYNQIDAIKQPYAGFDLVILKDWDERKTPETQLDAIMQRIRAQVSKIPEARIAVINAPAIPGLGAISGFTFEIEDLNGAGMDALQKVTANFLQHANQQPELQGKVYTTFTTNAPQRYLDIDREKAKMLQVSLTDLFQTLQINLGSSYVNQFNKFGRVYRVYIQADQNARMNEEDIGRLKVRNSQGQMIDLSALVKIRPIVGPYNITHYNEFNAITINGSSANGFSSGDAIDAMEKVASQILPEGFGYEWTNITYQQLKAGNIAPLIFALSLIFVFLVLAAQYESWSMPIMVLLGVPLGLMGAIAALLVRDMCLDVYGQIGLVMLIGLTAKNGILIVEFANDLRRKGKSPFDAAVDAAKIRLRPILMTALAFVIGLIPLVIASGAGAASRQSLGTAVVGGLAVATILVIFVPAFYYIIEKLRERTIKIVPETAAAETKNEEKK